MSKWWKNTIRVLTTIRLCRVARYGTAGPQAGNRRRRDTTSSDNPFEEKVCNLFEFGRAVTGIAFPKVPVQLHHDKVTLAGTVNNPIDHAIALAWRGDDVFFVHGHLIIVSISCTVEEQPEWRASLFQETQFPITKKIETNRKEARYAEDT